jgi:hypothetical protein
MTGNSRAIKNIIVGLAFFLLSLAILVQILWFAPGLSVPAILISLSLWLLGLLQAYQNFRLSRQVTRLSWRLETLLPPAAPPINTEPNQAEPETFSTFPLEPSGADFFVSNPTPPESASPFSKNTPPPIGTGLPPAPPRVIAPPPPPLSRYHQLTDSELHHYWEPFLLEFKINLSQLEPGKSSESFAKEFHYLREKYIEDFNKIKKEILIGEEQNIAIYFEKFIKTGDKLQTLMALTPKNFEKYRQYLTQGLITFRSSDNPCFFEADSAVKKVNEIITRKFVKYFNEFHMTHHDPQSPTRPVTLKIYTLDQKIGADISQIEGDFWQRIHGCTEFGDNKIYLMVNRAWEISGGRLDPPSMVKGRFM